MIELNAEYTYEEICEEVGWSYQRTNNKTKQNQIDCIESSFEWFHPINKKTKKPKKSYIFTKQLKEPELEDGRKNNGGYRDNAGAKALLSEEEFDILWTAKCYGNYMLNFYGDRDFYDRITFTNSELFKDFGFDLYSELRRVKYEDDDNKVKWIFEEILYSKLKANTITKLTSRYDYPANNLPKTVLRNVSGIQKKKKEDKELLALYDAYEKEILEEYKCKNLNDARIKGVSDEVKNLIAEKFESIKKYGVIKLNVIPACDIDFSVFEQHANMSIDVKADKAKEYHLLNTQAEELKVKFHNIIIESFEKAVLKRIFKPEKYKKKLTWEQRKLLLIYLKRFTCKSYKEEFEVLDKKQVNANLEPDEDIDEWAVDDDLEYTSVPINEWLKMIS